MSAPRSWHSLNISGAKSVIEKNGHSATENQGGMLTSAQASNKPFPTGRTCTRGNMMEPVPADMMMMMQLEERVPLDGPFFWQPHLDAKL